MILMAWVGFSTIFCLALFSAAAHSIPDTEEANAHEADPASLASLSESLPVHCPAH
jgi:hypothetical protein